MNLCVWLHNVSKILTSLFRELHVPIGHASGFYQTDVRQSNNFPMATISNIRKSDFVTAPPVFRYITTLSPYWDNPIIWTIENDGLNCTTITKTWYYTSLITRHTNKSIFTDKNLKGGGDSRWRRKRNILKYQLYSITFKFMLRNFQHI